MENACQSVIILWHDGHALLEQMNGLVIVALRMVLADANHGEVHFKVMVGNVLTSIFLSVFSFHTSKNDVPLLVLSFRILGVFSPVRHSAGARAERQRSALCTRPVAVWNGRSSSTENFRCRDAAFFCCSSRCSVFGLTQSAAFRGEMIAQYHIPPAAL
jgi:hypothetical protein